MLNSCYIGRNRTDEEMENRVCSCPETGNPNEFGDGSSLPCMSDFNGLIGYPEITCRNCIYCIEKSK